MTDSQIQLVVTSAFGLETIVRHELSDLGYHSKMLQPGRQLILADEASICRANLFLRCAERVLIRLGHFAASDFDQLFDGVRQLPWERWIPTAGQFPVKAKSIKSQLTSLPAVQRAVKKAIVMRLQQAHRCQTLAETGAVFGVEVALLADQATLTIDTSGVGLHKRGYRPAAGGAPLRETLAAAMLKLSGWRPEMPLIDPFCGSGTIPIEAAMLGRSMAPGLRREFTAEHWPTLPAALWQDARGEARDLATSALPQRLLGTDINNRSLDKARENARRAGVEQDVHFQQKAFADLTSSRQFGCLVGNPPYGNRLQDRDELASLYRSFPMILRRLPTWSHYILTAYPNFEDAVGQRATKRRKLYNGRIECQFYQFFGPRPARNSPTLRQAPQTSHDHEIHQPSPAAFGGLPTSAGRQVEEFVNRLRKRTRHLRRWPAQGVYCYRLYERDVPDVPLVVDRYEDWLHLAEFARPHHHTVAEHADWLDRMSAAAAAALEMDPAKVVLKQRRRQRGADQYNRQRHTEHELVVREREARFCVNLVDYIDTGLFLDHRETRRMVKEAADGKDVLNLFGYTGAFSVYAALGNAASTRTVDLSRAYLDWAGHNFALNNLLIDAKHGFIRADAPTYVRDLHPDICFDLAIVDPPTFSNSKALQRDWNVQRDHRSLLCQLAPHIRHGGLVFFSTNFRRFKFDGLEMPYSSIREISRQTVPEDFRNRRIHRCWRLQR